MASIGQICGNCGHAQISGIYNTPGDEIIKAFVKPANKNFSMVTFSDGVNRGCGKRLADYIKAMDCGPVIETPPVQNVQYQKGHMIQSWTWVVDRPALAKWEQMKFGTINGVLPVVPPKPADPVAPPAAVVNMAPQDFTFKAVDVGYQAFYDKYAAVVRHVGKVDVKPVEVLVIEEAQELDEDGFIYDDLDYDDNDYDQD